MSRIRLPIAGWMLLVAAFLLWTESSAWACPNCRDALASDPDQAGMVRGLFWSIIFLLSMPFLIFTALSGYFYWLVRRTPTRAVAGEYLIAAESPGDMTSASPRAASFAEERAEDVLEPAGV